VLCVVPCLQWVAAPRAQGITTIKKVLTGDPIAGERHRPPLHVFLTESADPGSPKSSRSGLPTNFKPPSGGVNAASPSGERFPHHAAEYAALRAAQAGEGLAQKQKSANGAKAGKRQDGNPFKAWYEGAGIPKKTAENWWNQAKAAGIVSGKPAPPCRS
jgi:hypothetical protein